MVKEKILVFYKKIAKNLNNSRINIYKKKTINIFRLKLFIFLN